MPTLTPPGHLTDGVIELRRWRDGDAAVVARVQEMTADRAREWVARQRSRSSAIGVSCAIARPAGAAIGYVGLIRRPRVEAGIRSVLADGTIAFNPHRSVAGIGYWVAPDEQGRRVATRAAVLLSRWGLTDGGLTRVECLMDPRNIASERVAVNAGFQLEGRLRSYLELDGEYCDALVYSLLARDLA